MQSHIVPRHGMTRHGRQRRGIPQCCAHLYVPDGRPLTNRPFLPPTTKSELMVVMTSGMAHISGGMMAGYIQVGGADPKNLLTASS